jgi:N-acetylneuraminic acid mutarotase
MNGKIYVIGGFLAQVHVGAQNAAFEYDPAADRWRTLAPLKVARGSIAVAVLNGRIHAIGGRTADRVTSTVHEVYDPASNSWSDAAPLPVARDHLFVGAANGRIHVIGGRTNTPLENVNRHDIYDAAKNTWTTGPALPTARSGGASLVYKGLIVTMGGECNNFRPFAETEAFDVQTGRWRTLAPMPIGKHGITAGTDGQTIYIAGGNPECGLAYSNRLVTFTLP